MNKNLCEYIRDYIKRLEHHVLTSSENNLRLHFVFFPKEIERLKMKWEYAKTIGNYTTDRGLIYCDMYFNIPKIYKFIYINYKDQIVVNKEAINIFLQKIFFHEYRHYEQMKEIKELHSLIFIPDFLRELLEIDADGYAIDMINEGQANSINHIRKEVQLLRQKLKPYQKPNINNFKHI